MTNKLTNNNLRVHPPDLTKKERAKIIKLCQEAGHGKHVKYKAREYWVEGPDNPPSDLWCVCWEEDEMVSGHPIYDET